MHEFLCASCGSAARFEADEPISPASRCVICSGTLLLDERFRLERILARGAIGTTYLATRLSDRATFAIKELSFARLDSFKTQELFAREARILTQLDHPGIPAHHDDFVWGIGKHQAFYLVEDYIPGTTLEQELSTTRPSEREVFSTLLELARILEYLHTRIPCVIHRDIKPDNIMRSEDGQLVLIDFGAVRDDIAHPNQPSGTLAGTPGYMAPEQALGSASPASDIWAAGVLAVVMLTRQQPASLIEQGGRFAWREALEGMIDQESMALLEEMLCEEPGERIKDGSVLASRLEALLDGRRERNVSRPRATNRPGSAPRPIPRQTSITTTTSTAMTTERHQRGESMFGLYMLAGAGMTGALPCVIVFVGLSEAAIATSALLLLMILMIPFLPADEPARDPSRLLEE